MPPPPPALSPRSAPPRPGRAAPMPAGERRAAIVEATIPLLRECGLAITTRRIAEAAQVAEGTIFSVFPDKETLIAEAVHAALAPAATIEQVEAVDCSLPLPARLEAAVAALQQHFADAWRLLVAVGPSGAPREMPPRSHAFTHFGPALQSVLQPDARQLRTSPAEAARALLALTLGCSHPAVVDEPVAPGDVVTLFLDGIRKAKR